MKKICLTNKKPKKGAQMFLFFLISQTFNWVHVSNGTASAGSSSDCDYAYSVVVSNDTIFSGGFIGNTYKAGHIVALDTSGTSLWTYTGTYPTSDCEIYDIVSDGEGNIYATGYLIQSSPDIWILKIKDGSLVWEKTCDGGVSGFDIGHCITYGTDSYIYIAGENEAPSDSGANICILKVDTAGNILHEITIDGGYSADRPNDILYTEVNGEPYIYVAGYMMKKNPVSGMPERRFYVCKFDTALSPTSLESYIFTQVSNSEAYAITRFHDGNIYVVGYENKSLPWGEEISVVALTPDTLGEVFHYFYHGTNGDSNGNSDRGYDIVSDNSGYLYLCGYSYYDAQQVNNAVIICIDTLGNQQWLYEYNPHLYTPDDIFRSITIYKNFVFATGYTLPYGTVYRKLLLAGLTTSGTEIFNTYYPDGDSSEGYNVVYSNGNLYIAGMVEETNDHKFAVFSYSVEIDTIPPAKVTLISPDSGIISSQTAQEFTWKSVTDASGIKGYIFQLSYEPSFASTIIDTMLSDTAFSQNFSNDTTFYWRVQALDSAGNYGEWSNIWDITIDGTVPTTPVLISPVNDTILYLSSVQFQWTSSSKGTPVHYVIKIDSIGPGFISPFLVDTVDTNVYNYTFTQDGEFWWSILAFDDAGNTSGTSIDSFILDKTPPVIDSVTIWTDTTYRGPFEVRMKVVDVSPLSAVEFYYHINSGTSVTSNPVSIGNNWFVDTIPEIPGTEEDTVYYSIYAADAGGNESEYPSAGAISFRVLEDTTSYTIVWENDFESDSGNMEAAGDWEWGDPEYSGSYSGPSDAHSGTLCWGTVLTGDYSNSSNSILTTPPITIPATLDSFVYLSFYMWFYSENYYDGGNVKISLDNTTFSVIQPVFPSYDTVIYSGNAGIPGENAWTDTIGAPDWIQAKFDLSNYVGETVYIRFHFGSDGSVVRPGWYIDDVTIYGLGRTGTMSRDIPEKDFLCVDPLSEKLEITFGLSHQTDISIRIYDITGRLVRKPIRGSYQAGIHRTEFKLRLGVYFVVMEAQGKIYRKKVIILR